MNLRTALKITRYMYDDLLPSGKFRKFSLKGYKRKTTFKAKQIGRRKWRDNRFPYIDSEEEEREKFELMGCLLADACIEDEESREEFKKQFLFSREES